CISNGRWYEPPISFTGLAKSLRAAVHHSSPIYVKRNILASTFIPHPWFSQQDFSRFVLDFLVFGNAFLEKRYSTTGKVIRLETSPAKYTRRGVEEDVYWWVPSFNEPTAFAPGSVFHLLEPDINQELYGLPEYLSALNSAWLNESATLFRRKYYENGAHAGYIMYVTDAVQDRNDIEMLRENMVKSKGRNNFKNLFLYAPQGKADGIKIIPLSEVATKDDFFNIKKSSAADLLDAHRIPFQLMGGKPENVGSLGDIEKVAKVFVRNELIPLQDRIREINGWLGQEVIRFKNYSLDTDNG
ncbi:phage portal protein, partial [Escherichia coli]